MKGILHVVGFGPGGKDHMTFKAYNTMADADVVVGYTTYIDMVRPLFPGQEFISTGMTREIDRCRMAIEIALTGKDVAMISSGDSGIYGMAGAVFQMVQEMKADIDVDVVPGVTAASAAASVLGAPLMHDFSIISLSDLMTPQELIEKRLDAAGASDMIVCLYNPKSHTRTDKVEIAQRILLEHRSPDTPVGCVRNAGREGENAQITTLGALDEADIDMFTLVIIGNSRTYVHDGRMITPRGYRV